MSHIVSTKRKEAVKDGHGQNIPGPALAIDNKNGLSCFMIKFSSSNLVP